jgi:hypothetical protein
MPHDGVRSSIGCDSSAPDAIGSHRQCLCGHASRGDFALTAALLALGVPNAARAATQEELASYVSSLAGGAALAAAMPRVLGIEAATEELRPFWG